MLLTRRLLTTALVGASLYKGRLPAAAELPIIFQADDRTFTFDLPPRWVPVTLPDKERDSTGHLISVRAQQADGLASVQAIVDGGFRGRKYGSALSDLGPLAQVADTLVSDALLNDDEAKSAAVYSAEKTGGFGGSSYYVVRYQVGAKPAVAKLAVLQQRLYCCTVRAEKPAKLSFFDDESQLRADMESIIDSYSASPVNAPCLDASSKGSVPAEGVCRVLRP